MGLAFLVIASLTVCIFSLTFFFLSFLHCSLSFLFHSYTPFFLILLPPFPPTLLHSSLHSPFSLHCLLFSIPSSIPLPLTFIAISFHLQFIYSYALTISTSTLSSSFPFFFFFSLSSRICCPLSFLFSAP
ncbi:MAG: hypothetical protein JOS17DRAFT_559578 [Linnemannia elongata]|nr:MAG: hypothetical protein JOS17DRAFT_559578 [Linnemannia elongata]